MAQIHLKLVDDTSRDIDLGQGGNAQKEFEEFLHGRGHFSAAPGWVRVDGQYIRVEAIVHADLRGS